MSAIASALILFITVFIVISFLIIINKEKSKRVWVFNVFVSLFLSFSLFYLKDMVEKYEIEISEEEYRKELFFWKMQNDDLILDYGILQKNSFFEKPKNIMYVRVPSLKELNENEKMKKEFTHYRKKFSHEKYTLDLPKPNISVYKERYNYVLFEDDNSKLYPIDLIYETLQKKYKILEKENYYDLVLENVNYIEIDDVYFYTEMKKEFISNGFNFIENEESKYNIIISIDNELSDDDYIKLLTIYEKYKKYKLGLIIIYGEKENKYSHEEIMEEIYIIKK